MWKYYINKPVLDKMTRDVTLPWDECDTKFKGSAAYGMTLEEVAKVMGVTRERVRGIETKALNKLRDPKNSKILRHFL